MVNNVASFDLGSNFTAVSLWQDDKLNDFYTFQIKNEQDFLTNINSIDFTNFKLVIIEKQLSKNTVAKCIEAQFRLFFKLKYPNVKFVVYEPKKKYSKATMKMKYNQRKKWAVETVKKYIEENCPELEKKYLDLKKKDDVADSILIKNEYNF